jgi:hypothetical protein
MSWADLELRARERINSQLLEAFYLPRHIRKDFIEDKVTHRCLCWVVRISIIGDYRAPAVSRNTIDTPEMASALANHRAFIRESDTSNDSKWRTLFVNAPIQRINPDTGIR